MKRVFKIKKRMVCVYIFLGLMYFWGVDLINPAFYPYLTVFAIITAVAALFEKIYFNEKFILCVIRGGSIVTLSAVFFFFIAIIRMARDGVDLM